MPNPRLAARYAKSVLDLSVSENQLEAVLKDMQLLKSIVSQNRDLELLLLSPIVKGDKKKSILDEILKGNIRELTSKFLALMIVKGREKYLPEIATAFQNQYNDLKQIQVVKVTTAVAMDENVRNTVNQKIATLTPGKTIEIKAIVNPEIIGGFIIEMDDKLYDASVRTELYNIKKQFSKNDYIANI